MFLTADGANGAAWEVAAGGGGTVTGGGANTYVAYWTAASNITGTANYVFTNATSNLALGDGSAGQKGNITSIGVDASTPVYLLQNNKDDATSPSIELYNHRDALSIPGAQDNDTAGSIKFFADDDNATGVKTEAARLSAKLANVNHGTERGYIALSVAEYDGTMTEGLILSGGSSDGIINSNFVSTLGVSGLITASGGLTMHTSQVFTMGGNGVDDILVSSDSVSTADDELVSADYVGTHYAPVAITGTVTSVAIGGNDGIDVDSGSPITTAGTIQLGLSNIPNSSLANNSVNYGGVTVALGASDTTPAFDLADATNYPGTSALVTVGTITAGTWQGTEVGLGYGGTELVGETDGKIVVADGAGAPTHLDIGSSTGITILGTIATGVWNGTAITNAYLANSSVSYGGVSVALGASDATPAFDLADATNYEGTAVKSTGETGGSKFLREDGDGTCSWQAAGGGGTVTTSGSPVDDDFAKFTDSTTIEGRSYSEVKSDLGLGTAAERAAEDTLTDGSNLPDGAAIKAYGDSNWSDAGTVTSVAIGGNDGIDVDSGSPITSAGTIQLGLSNIPNASLANTSVNYGGVTVALGASDTTPAFDLADATNYEGTAVKSTGEGLVVLNSYVKMEMVHVVGKLPVEEELLLEMEQIITLLIGLHLLI